MIAISFNILKLATDPKKGELDMMADKAINLH